MRPLYPGFDNSQEEKGLSLDGQRKNLPEIAKSKKWKAAKMIFMMKEAGAGKRSLRGPNFRSFWRMSGKGNTILPSSQN